MLSSFVGPNIDAETKNRRRTVTHLTSRPSFYRPRLNPRTLSQDFSVTVKSEDAFEGTWRTDVAVTVSEENKNSCYTCAALPDNRTAVSHRVHISTPQPDQCCSYISLCIISDVLLLLV